MPTGSFAVMGYFASEETAPLAAETIFTIASFNVTNAMLMGLLTAGIIVSMFFFMAVAIRKRPNSKFAFVLESLAMFVLDNIKKNFGGDEAKARKFLPLFLALFTFILINNLAGLLPGMGGSVYVESNGIKAALLRPFTTDLNGTLALAFISMMTVQIFAIKERGLFGYVKHFFTIMPPWWNPMNFFIGFIEIFGELTRLLTLALRLFGVVYAGEVVLHIFISISGIFSPLAVQPIIFLEIFFSFIQAYLFIMLSSVYLAVGTSHDEDHASKQDDKDSKKPSGAISAKA